MLGKLKPKCGRHEVQSEDFEHWLLGGFYSDFPGGSDGTKIVTEFRFGSDTGLW